MEKRCSDGDEKKFRGECINFVVQLCNSLRNRLPSNITVLRKINLIAVQNTLRVIKPELIDILSELHYSADRIEKIITQWSTITIVSWTEKKSTTRFWAEVISYMDAGGNNPFQELAEFAWHLLALPFSNAEVERVFSQMNIVKTKLRNRMQAQMLNAILNVRASLQRDNICCHDFKIPQEVTNKI